MEHTTVEQLAKGKVGYYWEDESTSPVIEVFYRSTASKVETIATTLNNRLRDIGIPQQKIEFETDGWGENYQRIYAAFSFDNVEEDELRLANEELSVHGEAKYDEQGKVGFWIYPQQM